MVGTRRETELVLTEKSPGSYGLLRDSWQLCDKLSSEGTCLCWLTAQHSHSDNREDTRRSVRRSGRRKSGRVEGKHHTNFNTFPSTELILFQVYGLQT